MLSNCLPPSRMQTASLQVIHWLIRFGLASPSYLGSASVGHVGIKIPFAHPFLLSEV